MDKEEIYIEESCDIEEFEKKINKTLSILSKTREIVNIQYKTGFAYEINGITKNWYSIALLHKKRESFQIEEIEKRIFEAHKLIKQQNDTIAYLDKKINRQTVEINKLINLELNRRIEQEIEEKHGKKLPPEAEAKIKKNISKRRQPC